MVGKRFALPVRMAYWGVACLTWCGFVIAGQSGFGQEQKAAKQQPVEKQAVAAVEFPKPETTDNAEDAAERKALEEGISGFVTAFNAHDLKAISGRYTTNAELTDQGGRVTRGRDAIHDVFSKLFTEQPKIKIHLHVQSLRFLSSELAVEDGTSMMTAGDAHADESAHHDRYTVTHVKHDGKWLIAGARDWAPTPATGDEQLKQLEWLVGEWVDENSDTLMHTTYHWSEDKRYLFSKYSVHRAGRPAVEGMQRIGWDPQLRQIHSWTFDNAGGFSEGLWSQAGNQWIVKLSGVVADGRVRSSTNILTRLGPDHASYQSRDRVIGSEVQPDLDPVPIVRKPPQPSLPKAAQTAAGKAPQAK